MAFKDQLMTALHEAVGYFNECGDPSQAVIKTAKDNDFNADQTQRLLETFNTARTIYHYKSAADRTVSFPLADREAVMTELFGKVEEKVAEAADHDYSEYDVPMRKYVEPSTDEPAEKQASSEHELPFGLTLDNAAAEAMNLIRVRRTVVKAAADEARVAGVKAAEVLERVADTFRFGEQSDRIARLTAGYMDDSQLGDVVTKLAEHIPSHRCPTTDELRRCMRQNVIDDSDLGLQVELLKEAKQWMDTEVELLAVAGQLQKEADEFERAYAELFSGTFPGEKSAADLIKISDSETVQKQKYTTSNMFGEPVDIEHTSGGASKKDPMGISGAIAQETFDSAKAPVQKFLETGVDRAFTQPAIEANKKLSERMKNVQRQIMLQDLIVNDPVLADEPPETVAEAYNSLLQLAPEVAANKEVVRAILRQTVHSVAVSPYDAEMWTKLERNLRNIKGKGGPVMEDNR